MPSEAQRGSQQPDKHHLCTARLQKEPLPRHSIDLEATEKKRAPSWSPSGPLYARNRQRSASRSRVEGSNPRWPSSKFTLLPTQSQSPSFFRCVPESDPMRSIDGFRFLADGVVVDLSFGWRFPPDSVNSNLGHAVEHKTTTRPPASNRLSAFVLRRTLFPPPSSPVSFSSAASVGGLCGAYRSRRCVARVPCTHQCLIRTTAKDQKENRRERGGGRRGAGERHRRRRVAPPEGDRPDAHVADRTAD